MGFSPINVRGLPVEVNATANRLLVQLDKKFTRNVLRSTLYEGKRRVDKISEILPPHYSNLGITLGWTAKAVDLLALRANLEGFELPGTDLDGDGLRTIYDENMLGAEVKQGITASLIHSTAFVTTTQGGEGEPAVVWQFFDATRATGDWDARARKLTSLIVLNGHDDKGKLDEFILYLPNQTYTCRREGGWAVVDHTEHKFGVPAEPLPYSPSLLRPFGRSRISRPMIGLQSQAIRGLLRLEGHMDIYAYPDFWMLGADPSILTNTDGLVQTSWAVMMGRIKGVPDDPAQDIPGLARADVKQFPAASPEPHLAAINALSKLFAREASLPDWSLAITDFSNPTSAESYDASQYDLIAEAEGATDAWGPYLQRAMLRSLQIANNLDDIPAEWAGLQAVWRNPRYISRSAAADAGLKQLTAAPWLSETEVGLELLGLSSLQAERAMASRVKAESRSVLEQLLNAGAADDNAG